MVDADITEEGAKLYDYLRQVADSTRILYGHQNEYTTKVARWLDGASDTEDMVHDHAAVFGIDALALTGVELDPQGSDREKHGIRLASLIETSHRAVANGSIITMSCHIPNLAEVAKKGRNDERPYGYDFSGYSPNNLSGSVAERILPGGDLHPVYTAYLDMIADYIAALQQERIGILFRPFHECDGGWFWWGSETCSPDTLRSLYRFTVAYCKDTKKLHNVIYVFSPDKLFSSEADYALRYPGDDVVDMVGFDMYHRMPAAHDSWMQDLSTKIGILESFAAAHGKVAAITEIGIAGNKDGNGGIPEHGFPRPRWFTEVLDVVAARKVAYILTWANFGVEQCYEPYIKKDGTAHEMVKDFRQFYKDKRSIFASERISAPSS